MSKSAISFFPSFPVSRKTFFPENRSANPIVDPNVMTTGSTKGNAMGWKLYVANLIWKIIGFPEKSKGGAFELGNFQL